MSQLKAPNGKPTNLNPEQWKLVRTSQFKAWFGDWENDPENASKVVDENFEPLVVYHGSNNIFTIFDKQRIGSNTKASSEVKVGFYFTTDIVNAKSYATEKNNFLSCFLNVRNLGKWNFEGRGFNGEGMFGNFPSISEIVKIQWDKITSVKKGYISIDEKWLFDGILAENIVDSMLEEKPKPANTYVVWYPNQIKLADGSNTTFDGNNPDIRFAEGGTMKKFSNGGNADPFDLSSILSEFGLDDIIADIEKKSSTTKGKKITRKTKEDKKIFGDFIFADDDPNTINFTLRNVTERFIIEQGNKEANTPEETRLLSLLKAWVDSIAEADNIADSKPLLEKLRDQYPQYFAPSNPNGTLMFRGLSKVQSYTLDDLRKMKISDFVLYKENDGSFYPNDARTKFILLKKPIDYVPSREIQSWTPILKSAQGFYREGMLVTKQDDDFFINENTLEKIYGSDENENIHIGKEFKNNVYLSLRYDYFASDVLPYLIEDISSNETFLEASEKLKFADGGNTNKRMKKIKRGGITYGKSHAEGGIPVKNESTGDMLEVEGGEGIVNKRSMASGKKVKLNGKEMTICEAVSQLNQIEGGVQFSCDDVSDQQFIEAMAKGGELERGTRTEKEHMQVLKDLYSKRITPKQASKRIAKDHLKEDTHYYSKLAKMEGKMADGGMSENLEQYIDLKKTKREEYEIITNLNTLKALQKVGLIEFTEMTGQRYRVSSDAIKRELHIPSILISVDNIKSALKPQFNFRGNEFFIGYEKVNKMGKEIYKLYVLKKGKYWDKYNLEEKMKHGGLMLDKESQDLLSEIYAKYADGGAIDTDDEKINMQDYEGYIDVYNERKKAFQGSSEKFQKLLEEGIEVKNDPNLSDEEKNKQLDEIRKNAKEAKAVRVADRDNFVDMRNVDSPFYAPQLADGGFLKSLPKGARIPKELKPYLKSDMRFSEGDWFQFKIGQSPKYPNISKKGYDVILTLSPNSKLLEFHFYISAKAMWDTYMYGYEIAELLKNIGYEDPYCKIKNVQKSRSVEIQLRENISFIESYNLVAIVIESLSNKSSWDKYTKTGLSEIMSEQTTPATTSSAPSDWNWRFKTKEESAGGGSFIYSMEWMYGQKFVYSAKADEIVKKILSASSPQYTSTRIDVKDLGLVPPTDINYAQTEAYFASGDIINDPLPQSLANPSVTTADILSEVKYWTRKTDNEVNANNSSINMDEYDLMSALIFVLVLNLANLTNADFDEITDLAKKYQLILSNTKELSEENLNVSNSFVMDMLLSKLVNYDIEIKEFFYAKLSKIVNQKFQEATTELQMPQVMAYLAKFDTFDRRYIMNI